LAKKPTVLVLGAHSDDPTFGAGGTIAKYAQEGKKVKSIIFSYGELSPPHLKPEIVRKTRVKEADRADKILGGSGVTFFDLKEGRFPQGIKDQRIKAKLKKILQKEKPEKIFTHGANDAHPDHIAIHYLIKEMMKKKEITCEVYCFDIWNVVRIRKRVVPRLVVNITSTFAKKIRAVNVHESQTSLPAAQFLIFPITWMIYFKAIVNGWNNNYKYAEVFDKIE
jgi:LmbE family N-acetylglucosaminyl deacetylase